MHPSVTPEMSSGGGASTNTFVTEDWVLRYPKCTGEFAVKCSLIPAGTKCNNCQWQNSLLMESCRDTAAHELGHTIDLHAQKFMKDLNIEASHSLTTPALPFLHQIYCNIHR